MTDLTPGIIFEDDYLLVLDKPAGMVVNNATTTKGQETLQSWLVANFAFPIFSFPEARNGIVHRLDKETSGLMAIAKTIEVFRALQAQFKERKVNKSYLTLVHGKVVPVDGEINISVGRLPWNRQRFGVLPGGREAVTLYKVKGYYLFPGNKEAFSFLEVFPKTGRTHQIRIHLKHIGHPVVGDSFYAGRKTSRCDRLWCPRLFLNAAKLEYTHPITKKTVSLRSPLPKDLVEVFKKLDKDNQQVGGVNT
jgi:23S rRNA pseudouridine1911/1915/1917 synthase